MTSGACDVSHSDSKRPRSPTQILYKIALPVALILWLLPLLGVAMTSLKPSSDLAGGQHFRAAELSRLFPNYGDVFRNSPIAGYILNSLQGGTIPTVIGAIAISCLSGFCARGLSLPVQPGDLLPVRGRQFRTVPDPDGAGARPHGLDRTVQTPSPGSRCSTSPSSRASAHYSCATSSRACRSN